MPDGTAWETWFNKSCNSLRARCTGARRAMAGPAGRAVDSATSSLCACLGMSVLANRMNSYHQAAIIKEFCQSEILSYQQPAPRQPPKPQEHVRETGKS